MQVVFSTSTETGQDMAKRLVKEADVFIYFPLDFPFVVRKTLDLVHPDVFALVETELWPNFLAACSRRGISSLMVNGRISPVPLANIRRQDFSGEKFLIMLQKPE